ncbi:MAG: acetate/propionate family kinase [Methylococcaceae bacterium]
MILVLNSGSSSIKYRLFEPEGWRVLEGGTIERIESDHRAAVASIVERLQRAGHLDAAASGLTGIGHRVVHGGETFHSAVVVNETVIQAIRDAIPLAPLHNPPNLLGIEVCRDLWPEVPQVAVFDTAFHQTMPAHAYRYALPEHCYRELKIRRYGFHGTSYAYVTRQAADFLGKARDDLNAIVLHLGNGASMAAIAQGQSMDTSMGMTPVAGLMMGTRCGDLDPGVILYLLSLGHTASDIDRLLNRDSGLKGLTQSNDMRDVLAQAEHGQAEARLALDIYVHRIRFYLGAYLVQLGRIDALIFTGGIGEHAAPIRERICAQLEPFGLRFDAMANQKRENTLRRLETAESPVAILVIPTDEEREIAEQTGQLLLTLAH